MYLKKFDLSGRRAYVTGGGRAIGLSCCEALAEAGAQRVDAVRQEGAGVIDDERINVGDRAERNFRPAFVR